MLSKLMKHELRATRRTMLPAILIMLAVSLAARFSVNTLVTSDNDVLNLLGTLLVVAYAIVVAGLTIVCLVLMVLRFYKNMMGDEGYLMFTLPVSVHQHIWSKLLVAAFWMVLSVLTILLGSFLLVVNLETDLPLLFETLQRVLGYIGMDDWFMLSLYTVLGLVSLMTVFLEVYAAISVGCSLPNGKLFWSFIIFFAFQFVVSFISGLLPVDAAMIEMVVGESTDAVPRYYLLAMGELAVRFGVFYGITAYFLQKRLNLE